MQRNLALGKKVSNISNAQAVTDGDVDEYDGLHGFGHCRWPCDVIVDLEVLCTIDTINLYLWDRDNRFYYYRVYVSRDNKNWMKIADKSIEQSKGKQIINAEKRKGQYVRIECLYNNANREFHIVQVEVFGEPKGENIGENIEDKKSGLSEELTYDVFLSYSAKDQNEADELYRSINANGGKAFLSAKSLKPGHDFVEEIRNAILVSNEIWLIVSPNSLKSEWVTTEWGAAWALKKPIIPILHRCSPEQLPERLKTLQCIDFYKVKEFVLDRFRKK